MGYRQVFISTGKNLSEMQTDRKVAWEQEHACVPAPCLDRYTSQWGLEDCWSTPSLRGAHYLRAHHLPCLRKAASCREAALQLLNFHVCSPDRLYMEWFKSWRHRKVEQNRKGAFKCSFLGKSFSLKGGLPGSFSQDLLPEGHVLPRRNWVTAVMLVISRRRRVIFPVKCHACTWLELVLLTCWSSTWVQVFHWTFYSPDWLYHILGKSLKTSRNSPFSVQMDPLRNMWTLFQFSSSAI